MWMSECNQQNVLIIMPWIKSGNTLNEHFRNSYEQTPMLEQQTFVFNCCYELKILNVVELS